MKPKSSGGGKKEGGVVSVTAASAAMVRGEEKGQPLKNGEGRFSPNCADQVGLFYFFGFFLGDFNTSRPVLGGFLPMGFRRPRSPLPALFLNDPEEKGAVLRHD